MEIENLRQFNKKDFKKYFALYMKQKRNELGISLSALSSSTGLAESYLVMVEAGQKAISQEEFDLLSSHLSLSASELLNIGKIIQVQNILQVYKEIDELYPK